MRINVNINHSTGRTKMMQKLPVPFLHNVREIFEVSFKFAQFFLVYVVR